MRAHSKLFVTLVAIASLAACTSGDASNESDTSLGATGTGTGTGTGTAGGAVGADTSADSLRNDSARTDSAQRP